MSADIIDIAGPLEDRQFKDKEKRLQTLREAFRAARLEASAAKKARSAAPSSRRRKKSRNPSR